MDASILKEGAAAASWWPGLVVGIIGGLIILLFIVTLLLHFRFPRLHQWLQPILTRIAPAVKKDEQQQQHQETVNNKHNHPSSDSSHLIQHQHHHSSGYPRSRPSRPSSLPCLPEEKLLAYYPSTSSAAVAVAAAAAVQAAQAATMSHRQQQQQQPRSSSSSASFYPPADDDQQILYERSSASVVYGSNGGSSGVAATRRSQQQQQNNKLNLHSDGSEASNSSSSASAATNADAISSQQQHHRSCDDVVGLRQRPANRDLTQQQSTARSSRIHQFRQQQEQQSSEDRDDEWTMAGSSSNHRPAMLQRQTSLVETDGDVRTDRSSNDAAPVAAAGIDANQGQQPLEEEEEEEDDDDYYPSAARIESSDYSTSIASSRLSLPTLAKSRRLSRSLATLTANGLGRFRSMVHLGPNSSGNKSESMMDMTDMSSTFGNESDSARTMQRRSSDLDIKAAVQLGLTYNPSSGKLAVRLMEIRQLFAAGRNGSVQLRLLLLPDRKQRHKSKVRCVADDGTAHVSETFVFSRIDPAELASVGVRFRLYCSERLRRERLLGQAFVTLSTLLMDGSIDASREQQLVVHLEPQYDSLFKKKGLASLGRSTSTSSAGSSRAGDDVSPTSLSTICASDSFVNRPWQQQQTTATPSMESNRSLHRPELLMGLAYNGTTGRLSVEILRAASLRSWSSAMSTSSNSFSSSVSSSVSAAVTRQPDVCVKLLLLSQTGQELDRAKTSLKKMSQVDGPTWLESFSFQVTLFQLAEVTLVLSVINKRSLKRRQLVGWISLGYDNSTEHQTLHWHEMMDAGGEQVCHWHQLMPPSSLSSTNKDHH